jgi:hypothetical protein
LRLPWRPNFEEIYILGDGWRGRHSVSSVLRVDSVPWQHGRAHPNQKPIPLIAQLLTYAPPGIICDPCMGSGTTGLACLLLGRDFVGIECDAAHYRTALTRLQAETEKRLL